VEGNGATARVRRRLAIGAASLLAVAVAASSVGYLAVSYMVAERFTHADRHSVGRAPQVATQAYEDVTLRTRDGLDLDGWYFPGYGDRAAILVHGKDGNRISGENRNNEKIAEFLLADGYDVLLFDLRGHGNSDGDRMSFGHLERLDVAAAIDYLTGRGMREDRIALIGLSMGAGTVLQTLIVRPNVGAVVADSSYEELRIVLEEKLDDQANVPTWFTPGVMLMSKIAFGLDGDQAKPIEVVRAHPERAVLFIHCDGDELVAPHHAYDLRAASANTGSDLWMATKCQHAWAFNEHPVEYQARLLTFLGSQIPTLAPPVSTP
jgi:fermentation-respiration switch protein FrsA (DUF1100 family)